MTAEIKDLMERLEPSREKIFVLTTKCFEFVSADMANLQILVNVWAKVVESSGNRLALLFLCNDLVRNNEGLRAFFQLVLSRAISLACTDFSAISDIRKLLKIWGDFQIFSRNVLADWDRLCLRMEQGGSMIDRQNFLYIISLGKKLKSLKALEGTNSTEVKKCREEAIKEIVNCMKKVFHGQLEIVICLQRLNFKGSN